MFEDSSFALDDFDPYSLDAYSIDEIDDMLEEAIPNKKDRDYLDKVSTYGYPSRSHRHVTRRAN